MAHTTGAVVGAAAAEKRRQMQLAEEQDMTQYTRDDLNQDWEFKIVRSDTGAFRRPEVLNRLLEEEARPGWVMLEKFDDSRIRFKRPRSACARDTFLADSIDSYRTQYGAPVTRQAMLIGVLLGLGFLALGATVFGYLLVAR